MARGIATLCAKLPEPFAVPVFRVTMVLLFPLSFTLSCVGPAAKFLWEMLNEYKRLFVEAPEIMEGR